MSFDPLSVLALAIAGALAGLLGALVGIGGGILLIPILTIALGVDLRLATATSLVAVVATSTATGSVFVGEGLANMRLGMTLEVATCIGAIAGGMISAFLPVSVLARIFAVIILVTAILTLRKKKDSAHPPASTQQPTDSSQPDTSATTGMEHVGTLNGAYYDEREKRLIAYQPVRVALGSAVAIVAGIVSGLLGVGGGFLKVPAMNLGMRVPLRVAAATSNFMLGVTAASSLFIYFSRGVIHPLLAAPVALGVAGGSLAGTKIGKRASIGVLRTILAVALLAVAVQMIIKGSPR